MFQRLPVAVLLAFAPAFGSDASGVIHPTCDLPSGYQLDLTNYGQHRLEKTIRFRIYGVVGPQMFPNKWLDIHGVECGEADPCAAYFSRIQILHLSYDRGQMLRLSGNVTLILDGGRKLEGSFTAKYVKPPQPLICE
jgi:hypothetical protein